jgi:hypothetical protein
MQEDKTTAVVHALFGEVSQKFADLIDSVNKLPTSKENLSVVNHFFNTGFLWLKEVFFNMEKDLAIKNVAQIDIGEKAPTAEDKAEEV